MTLEIDERLGALLDDANENEPGVILIAKYDDGKSYFYSRGMADVEAAKPCCYDTIFNLASLSKQFTAICIRLLERDCKISLTESIRKYIPELPSYADAVIINNLIHHTSGFKDYIEIAEENGVSIYGSLSPEESLEDICNCASLDFEPGNKFAYSNTNYFLLSILIERVTGNKISKYAHDMVFSPLEMNNTFYNESYPIELTTAKGYAVSESDLVYEHKESLWTQTGDGGVYSTAEDLIKWGQNFFDGKCGGSEIINAISTPMGEIINGVKIENHEPYASGLFVQYDFGGKSLLHSGSWIGYASFFVRHVDSKLTVAVLSNREDFNAGKVAYNASEILLNFSLNAYDSQSDFGY